MREDQRDHIAFPVSLLWLSRMPSMLSSVSFNRSTIPFPKGWYGVVLDFFNTSYTSKLFNYTTFEISSLIAM